MVKLAGEARVGTTADMINQTLKERIVEYQYYCKVLERIKEMVQKEKLQGTEINRLDFEKKNGRVNEKLIRQQVDKTRHILISCYELELLMSFSFTDT